MYIYIYTRAQSQYCIVVANSFGARVFVGWVVLIADLEVMAYFSAGKVASRPAGSVPCEDTQSFLNHMVQQCCSRQGTSSLLHVFRSTRSWRMVDVDAVSAQYVLRTYKSTYCHNSLPWNKVMCSVSNIQISSCILRYPDICRLKLSPLYHFCGLDIYLQESSIKSYA